MSMNSAGLGRFRRSSSAAAVLSTAEKVPWRRWNVAWLGAVGLALTNAMVRELAYREAVGERAAHQIASIALIFLIAVYVAMVERRWPIPTAPQALAIGASWAAATVTFEFVLGFATGARLSDVLANYNLLDGRLWVLVPFTIVFMPAAARLVRLSKHATAVNEKHSTDRRESWT